jgi:hypothetical protein
MRWSTKAAKIGDDYTVIILQTAMRKWHTLEQKGKGLSHLELLDLIFPAGPETRPAMQEQERAIGIPVTKIKIFYRAKIESMD